MTSIHRILLFALAIGSFFIGSAQQRVDLTINSHWNFLRDDVPEASSKDFNDSTWKTITLPHTWNDKDVLPDENRGYYRGIGWYRKHLKIIRPKPDKRYYLKFEGAGQEATLYVNGELVGTHIGGYSAFTFDVTRYLKSGDNLIAVKVDNIPNRDIAPLSADFTFFGGIYRDVRLITADVIHFDMLNHGSDGVFISTPNLNNETTDIVIRGSVSNDTPQKRNVEVAATIYDSKGQVFARLMEKISLQAQSSELFMLSQNKLKGFKLWSPEDPSMYHVEVSITAAGATKDEVLIPFGFRWFQFDANEGFFLNGKSLKLMGANRHQDYWGIGNALSDDQHRSDLQLLKDMGANFIRLAHYPQDPAVLDAADQLGLLVWEEIPLVNEVTISEHHHANAAFMVKDMIRQHYNHPSIIIWGYMNEIYWAHRFLDTAVVNEHTKTTLALAKQLEGLAREEDPTRYTGMALHNYPLYETSGIDNIPMVVGWNLYHGWYYDTYGDFGKFMDQQHEKHPERIHIISEYGAGSDPRLHSTFPERFDFTIEGQKRFSESFLKQILARPYIAGSTVWNLIDFSSERRIDSNPHLNNKGLTTADRTPKDPYYLFKAALFHEPVLKIAETNWTKRSGYPTISDTIVRQPVQVYSNLEEVELFMHGNSLGTKKIVDHTAIWQVGFTNGSHPFQAVGVKDGTSVQDHLTIDFSFVPNDFTIDVNVIDIAINAGCNYSFFDDKGKTTWLPDKSYSNGSWGFIKGEHFYVSHKIGTKEDILTTTQLEPLYQSIRKGSEGYQFDVSDGWYEVEMLFVEPFPKSRRFVEGIESPEHPGGERIFDVRVNDVVVHESLDLLAHYGYNYPLRTKVKVKAANQNGVRISLDAKKGETIISAIRVRKL